MRILFASHTYIVDLNCDKLRALAKLNSDIEIITIVPRRWNPGGVQNKIIETSFKDEGNFKIIPISNFSQNNQGLLTFGLDIIPILKKFKPNIIQVEQGAKSLAYAQLITLNNWLNLKAKNIFFTWWNLPYHLKFPISLLEKYNLNHSHGIIVGNHDGLQILRQRGYTKPITIIPQLGIDPTRFYPSPKSIELSQKLGINPDDFIIGYVGRFVKEKGLFTLFNSLTQLLDLKWKCLMLGRGPLESELKNLATKGISDRLIWIESVPHDQVPLYINLMDTLILPSETTYQLKNLTSIGWREQFGHVLIEAMSCRIPVIGSDSGEIPNVIKDTGIIFPEGNIEQLKNAITQLITNPQLRTKLADLGYQRALKYYTNQALALQTLDFYISLTNHSPNSPE